MLFFEGFMKKTLRMLLAILALSSTPLMASEEDYYCCCQQENYLYRWNVSTNPLGWLFGYYGVSVAYALNNNVALRGDIGATNEFNDDFHHHGVEFTVGLPIYFYSVYNGLFIEPQIYVSDFSSKGRHRHNNYHWHHSGLGVGALVGWHWMWDSGWNISAAFGFGRDSSCCKFGCSPRGYFQVGYCF